MPFIPKPRWAASSENCESFLSKIFTPSTTIYKNVHLFGANLLSESSKALHITSLCDPSIIHYSASRQSCQNLVRVIKTSSTRKPAATDTHSQPYFQDWWWKPWKMFKYFHLTIFWCAHLSLFFTDLTNIHCITLWWATMMSWQGRRNMSKYLLWRADHSWSCSSLVVMAHTETRSAGESGMSSGKSTSPALFMVKPVRHKTRSGVASLWNWNRVYLQMGDSIYLTSESKYLTK